MPYILNNITTCEPAKWVYVKDIFTPDECKKIIDIGYQNGFMQSSIGTNEDSRVDIKQRLSKNSFIDWHQNTDWIFSRLAPVIEENNARFFGIHLSGFVEALQITKYEEGDFYNWHLDMSEVNPYRKLTVVINLNSGDEYSGGGLELYNGLNIPKDLGYMAIFPSYEMHRARKVISGTRYSLVAWLHGPKFC